MDPNTLFTMALGLQSPWEVKSLQFSAEDRRLDILVDFEWGATFPCPEYGRPAKAHDTEEKTWRHLDFFQHAAYLTARVPRCKCDEHGVKQVQVPWARAVYSVEDRRTVGRRFSHQVAPEDVSGRVIGVLHPLLNQAQLSSALGDSGACNDQ